MIEVEVVGLTRFPFTDQPPIVLFIVTSSIYACHFLFGNYNLANV